MSAKLNDWSDSDDEDDALLGVQSSPVLLGVPDGPVVAMSDTSDVAVSRMGGLPAFLPSREPSLSSAQCKSCSNIMELIVQLWCPFEDSPMDRALYVWACAKAGCQRKEGSIRVWRGLRYNKGYAAKLERKLANRKEKEALQKNARENAEKVGAISKANPFSMRDAPVDSPLGLGTHIFGDAPPSALTVEEPEDNGNGDDESSATDDIVIALASSTLEASAWKSAPSYPPFYLSTVAEYLPSSRGKEKLPSGVSVEDIDADRENRDGGWFSEAYENSLKEDRVFKRFSDRVAYEGEQCIRYELGGKPLPFSSDQVFDILYPAPAQPNAVTVTKSSFTVSRKVERSYQPSSVPACPICKAKRIFECQLMPNLINVLKPSDQEETKPSTDQERIKAIESVFKGGNHTGGMEWGTCMIFSCERDCCTTDDGVSEDKECWREEIVLVQWDLY